MAYLVKADVETFLNVTLNPSGQGLGQRADPGTGGLRQLLHKPEVGCLRSANRDFDGGQKLYFPSITPITSVTSITIDGTALTSTEYFIYGGYIRLSAVAAAGFRNVVIIYPPPVGISLPTSSTPSSAGREKSLNPPRTPARPPGGCASVPPRSNTWSGRHAPLR